MQIDEFFEKQPPLRFKDELCRSVYDGMSYSFKKRAPLPEEISADGAYVTLLCSEWRDILMTATDGFSKFLTLTGMLGDRYPVKIVREDGFSTEAYKISVSADGCVISASDSEGARRAIYYLEEEMIKREGAFLPLGEVTRTPVIKRRITRGFFSPTNRAPKWGDELLDDVDYYPDAYLERLARAGTNGLWIYTSFAQLINSPYVKRRVEGCDRRMEKLRLVTEKCKRYGVKVYLFAIEPLGALAQELELFSDMLGADFPDNYPGVRRPLCPRIDKTREHVIFCLKNIFGAIPDLAGYISITAGERPTTCASVGTFKNCPRCGKYSRGENLAHSVDLIKEGLRQAGTGAEFISWTYGHRYWDSDDIDEYIQNAPSDVILMQNFEDKGIDVQLGKPRIAWDYWLSYKGPSAMFSDSARAARKKGSTMYAKMQVCSSHEIATVPYIPAPGILFDKYKEAVSLGVTGIMECWYFGNYPSLMNRASTELSYLDDFSDKDAFLIELASRLYGKTRASAVKAAWEAFEEAYVNYPTNIMFSYYGPMHDGVVWELFLIPKNAPLPRSWLLLDAPKGDRIGECLFKGHTLEEAITLTNMMCTAWENGLSHLPTDITELRKCAEAIGVLFASGRNILEFYRLRDLLGNSEGDSYEHLSKMEELVHFEIKNSERMIELCRSDARLGYHSEAEGFKFFGEKLEARIESLRKLISSEFSLVRSRIAENKNPLGFYFAEGEAAYPLTGKKETAEWVELDSSRSFSSYLDGDEVKTVIRCGADDEFSLCFEFSLFMPESVLTYYPEGKGAPHSEITANEKSGLSLGNCVLSHQSVYGEGINEELSKYKLESKFTGNTAEHVVSAKIPSEKWNKKRAIRLLLKVGGVSWKSDPDPTRTLGKADVSPEDFGFMLPAYFKF